MPDAAATGIIRSTKFSSRIFLGVFSSQKTITRFSTMPRSVMSPKRKAPPSSAYFVASSVIPKLIVVAARVPLPAPAAPKTPASRQITSGARRSRPRLTAWDPNRAGSAMV